jgi:cysteine desulfurase/selenocysteine lyase
MLILIMESRLDMARIRAETPGVWKSVFLSASGAALMPEPVIAAVVNHTMLEANLGGYEAQTKQSAKLEQVYDLVAGHINAKPNEIALMENATVAWAHAFYALPLAKGSRILTCEAEYAANYVAFLHRAKRDDLTIDVIPSDEYGTLDVDALAKMMDSNVSLIAITWVPTNGGLVNPAAAVGKIAQQHNVPYLLDACQAAGQMRIDVEALQCDFLSATGRKFLRGPRGTGFLYVREKWLATLEPAMIDHYGAPWVSKDQYELRDDARRFETWENSYALRAGLGAAITYADNIGIDAIQARVTELSATCRDLLSEIPQLTLQDLGSDKCAIISFTLKGKDPLKTKKAMAKAGFTISTSNISSTRLDSERRDLPMISRLAPHYYNTEDEIKRFTQALKNWLR